METMAIVLTKKSEEFRKIMAEYFELIGDNKTAKNILKESHEDLLLHAYIYAIASFKDDIKEYKEYIKYIKRGGEI